MEAGVRDIVGADSKGLVSTERPDYLDGSMNAVKRRYAEATNPDALTGAPADALEGADLFIGLSGARIFPADELAKMNADAMVFAMANPTPEVSPEEAAPYARIVATGRSDYPNQINNVLCFPGFFRGLLDCRAAHVTDDMKIAAAQAIASIVSRKELHEEYVIPSVFNKKVAAAVAREVIRSAQKGGVARRRPRPHHD